jgi:hydroxyquinol 1,2-dioxygenase
MRNMTEDQITIEALRRYEGTRDPRLKEIMTLLTKHLHAFVREAKVTEAEWTTAIEFLTRAGKMCVGGRQEFILLSDCLGVSMLVDLINHPKPEGATESTVLGPFFVEGAPDLPLGGNIAPKDPGPPAFISGRVIGHDRRPIAGAVLEIWQAQSDGFYDIQDPELPEFHMRARFRTDPDGSYRFRTVKPVSYPVPGDGPVGEMMRAAGRQLFRPGHVHFIIKAEGFETLTTHIFDSSDPNIDLDPVFGVKESLIRDFVRHDGKEGAPDADVTTPWYSATYDFVLKPALAAAKAA